MVAVTKTQKKSVTYATQIAVDLTRSRLNDLSFDEIEEELQMMRKKLRHLKEQEDTFKTDLDMELLNTKIQLFEEKRDTLLRNASYRSI